MSAAATAPSALPIAPPRLTVFDTGSETCPQGQLPGEAVFSVDEAKNASNPLQYMPVVGMLYQQATGQQTPAPLSILGSVAVGAAFGGPAGVVGSVLLNFMQEMVRLGPDTSRPAAPEGMDATGSEAAIRPSSPGSITQPGGYTTLATVLPDFLGGGADTQLAVADPSAAQVRVALNAYAGTMTSLAG